MSGTGREEHLPASPTASSCDTRRGGRGGQCLATPTFLRGRWRHPPALLRRDGDARGRRGVSPARPLRRLRRWWQRRPPGPSCGAATRWKLRRRLECRLGSSDAASRAAVAEVGIAFRVPSAQRHPGRRSKHNKASAGTRWGRLVIGKRARSHGGGGSASLSRMVSQDERQRPMHVLHPGSG